MTLREKIAKWFAKKNVQEIKKGNANEIQRAIESGKKVIIHTKKITVCYSLATRPEERKGVTFDTMYGKGLIVITKNAVKVYQMIDDAGGKEQLIGSVEKIEYDTQGDLKLVTGIARNWVDNEYVQFRIIRGLENIKTYGVSNRDNYYCEFDPTAATPQFKIAYLLPNTVKVEIQDIIE